MTEKRVRLSKRQQTFLTCLELAMGNVTVAAEKSNISRDSHYRWLNENEKYCEAVDMVTERNIDFVEGKLMKGIQEGSERLITYYLDNKGKSRGYGKSLTVSGDPANPVTVQQTTPEQVEAARQKLREVFPGKKDG